MARMSSGLIPSDEKVYMMTCTSLRIRAQKAGAGAVVRRPVRIEVG